MSIKRLTREYASTTKTNMRGEKNRWNKKLSLIMK